MIKEKILKKLIENNDTSFSINELSKKTKIDYKLAYTNVLKLKDEGVIYYKKLGNRNEIKFKFSYNDTVLNVELEKLNDIIKNKNLKMIYKTISKYSNPFFIILLFGSHAKMKATKHSDIDLCLICNDESLNKQIKSDLRIFPYDIHLVDFTTKEFISMLKTIDFNVGKEIVKNNIIFYGIENFYKILDVLNNDR